MQAWWQYLQKDSQWNFVFGEVFLQMWGDFCLLWKICNDCFYAWSLAFYLKRKGKKNINTSPLFYVHPSNADWNWTGFSVGWHDLHKESLTAMLMSKQCKTQQCVSVSKTITWKVGTGVEQWWWDAWSSSALLHLGPRNISLSFVMDLVGAQGKYHVQKIPSFCWGLKNSALRHD